MGFAEMLLISFLGFLLFGPKKSSELARQIGQHVSNFKRAAADLQSQVTESLDLPPEALGSKSVDGLRQSIVGMLAPALSVPAIDAATEARAHMTFREIPATEVIDAEAIDDHRQIVIGELAPGLSVPAVDATSEQTKVPVVQSGMASQMSENSFA